MRNNFLALVLILLVADASAQNILYQQSMVMDPYYLDEIGSYSAANPNTGEFAYFIFEGKTIKCFQVQEGFKQYLFITAPRPRLKNIIGSKVEGKKYTLFLSNSSYSSFETFTIDFVNNVTESKRLEVQLKGETFLATFTQNGKLYILTVKKQSSILRLHTYDNGTSPAILDFDFTDQKFSNTNFYKLSDVLKEVQVVQSEAPNPLELTSKPFKIYPDGDRVYLTLDNLVEFTRIISLSLVNSKDALVKTYYKTHTECKADLTKTNSFLLKNLLFLVKTCNKQMHFAICDISKDLYLKEFKATKDEDILFKNSPLIQEGGFVSNDVVKELDKSSEFFRKIAGDDIGISVYSFSNELEVKIGSSRILHNNLNLLMTSTFFGYFALFDTYRASRAVYFRSLFSKETYDYLKEDAVLNPFDRIKKYVKPFGDNLIAKTIFRLNNAYVLGYYLKKESKYYFIEFND